MLTVLTGEYDLKERSQRLHELLSVCRSGAVKPKIYLHLAQNLFSAGAEALKRGEFKVENCKWSQVKLSIKQLNLKFPLDMSKLYARMPQSS